MISIVLYGRNDNYGYNLHKRAALSLNCMAEVLTDPADEILFVDYNTPDDFPTFPEAIQDTLTRRAKERLRIFRVRPRVHERFKSKTHLPALEPIARNVAIRRSSGENRWILSTNTDMVFVPLRASSLSEIARGLAPGFYHAPRIEIPEVLWESLDRKDPAAVIKTVREWGSCLHLNEIVLGSKIILYDGPGDFQLMSRSDLFEHHGFDERMLLGWHVDSNIAARLQLKYGQVGDLGQDVYGYHCDHTRQVTPAHSHARMQNDWRRFIAEVTQTEVPEQAEVWGCVDDLVEELRLADTAKVYVQALRKAIGGSLTAAKIVKYTGETYNKVDYDPEHILPFLADMFAPMPRGINVAWYGLQENTLFLFARVWENLGFSGKILVDQTLPLEDCAPPAINARSSVEVMADASAFIFDFGGGPSVVDLSIGALRRRFLQVVRAERDRFSRGPALRRIIALNAINNEHEWFVSGLVAAAATPFATHMRHGFALPPSMAAVSWLAELGIGEAGVRVGNEVRNVPTKRGWIAYGPNKFLDSGTYGISLRIALSDVEDQKLAKSTPCVFLEVCAGANLLALHLLRYGELLAGDYHKFEFSVPLDISDEIDGIETRIAVMSAVRLAVRELEVQRTSISAKVDQTIPAVLRLEDWLPFLRVGELGRPSERGVAAHVGQGDFVVYGPYWSLPHGRYELTAQIEGRSARQQNSRAITADVMAADQQLVAATFDLAALPSADEKGSKVLRLPFEVADLSSEKRQIETRIWSSGEEPFTIRSVVVRPIEWSQQTDLLPYLLIGPSGQQIAREIHNRSGTSGIIAYSPILRLEHAAYRLALSAFAKGGRDSLEQTCALLIVRYGSNILEVLPIRTGRTIADQWQFTFEVPSPSEKAGGIQLLMLAVSTGDVSLRSLTIETVSGLAVRGSDAAILRIENWLPFLQTKPIAHVTQDGVAVGAGAPGCALYGPYWTLPPGDYELVGSAVPRKQNTSGQPIVTVDVTTEAGERSLAKHQWYVGHFNFDESVKIAELRLPFTIAADLPSSLRTIETRIFTSGVGGFRMRSLAVKQSSPGGKRDWFPYLAVGESGTHNGREIRSIAGRRGYVASTPPVCLQSGRYRLDIEIVASGDQACLGVEIWSRSQLIAIGKASRALPFEFSVSEGDAQMGVKLCIRAAAPDVFSIRKLVVEKTSTSIESNLAPPILQLDNWLPFLQTKPIAHADVDGILVGKGKPGYAIYGPYWILPPGDYELIGSMTPPAPDPRGRPLITIDVSTESGQRRLAEHQWHVGYLQTNEAPGAVEFSLPFTLAADLPASLRTIETRVFTSGDGSFRISSMRVNRISDPCQSKHSGDLPMRDFVIHRIIRATLDRAKLWSEKARKAFTQ